MVNTDDFEDHMITISSLKNKLTILSGIVQKQEQEIAELRKAISQIATNLGNGSVVSEQASLEFIKELPKEVELVIKGWQRKLSQKNT